jgi:hypothetical protein
MKNIIRLIFQNFGNFENFENFTFINYKFLVCSSQYDKTVDNKANQILKGTLNSIYNITTD